MKRFLLTICAAVALIATSCNPTPEQDEPIPDNGKNITEFSATIDNPAPRAVLNDIKSEWSNGDRLTVVRFDVNNTRPKLVTCNINNSAISGNSAKFTAEGYVNEAGEQYAIYPQASYAINDFLAGNAQLGRSFTFSLSNQATDSNGNTDYPLLIGNWNSATQSFAMHNPLAVMQVTLKTPASQSGNCTLNTIEISGNNDEALAGSMTVSTKSLATDFSKSSVKSITLTCNGIKVDNSGITMTIFVPKQNYSKGFTLTFKCTEGIMTKSFDNGIDTTETENAVFALNTELELEKASIFVSPLHATDTTVSIAWATTESNIPYISQIFPNSAADYTTEISKNYKVALYRNAECKDSDLVVSVDNIPGSTFTNTMPPRFIFTGLTPATDYYAMVYNNTDKKQTITPTKVSTIASVASRNSVVSTNAKVGDLLVFENFEGLIYAGDLSARAAGASRSDRSSLTSIVPLQGNIVLSDTDFIVANASTEIGLFNTLKGILDDAKIDKWGWIGGKDGANGGSICARPGFVKIGTSNNCSFICTPSLTALPKDKSTNLKVVFKAAPYGDAGKTTINSQEKQIAVKALAGASLGSDYAVSYTSVVAEQSLILDGEDNTAWKEYTVVLTGVPAGSCVAIGGGLSATTTNRLLLDDVRVYVESFGEAAPLSGTIKDKSGNGVGGVVVSDGYTVTKTDGNGKYEIPFNANARFIFYTTPAEYEIALAADGYPLFYKSIASNNNFDFVLGDKITKQNQWHLYVMADPQTNQTGKNCIPYFSNYIAADIKAMVDRDGFNSAKDWNGSRLAYGMVLGDVIWNSATESYMGSMKSAMAPTKTHVSWFTVPGNHDWYSSDSDTNPSLNCYNKLFGPSIYSFDRGDVHVVGMNNVITGAGVAVENYGQGFTADEYNWLVKDLEQVPTDKCVVLCVHIPFFDGENNVRHNKYYSETLNLLKKFANAYILSGHNHYSRHWVHSSYNFVHEMNHGAACGLYWNLKVCGDGTPAGYYVYTFEGNDCSNMLFKAGGSADYKAGINAMRMYLGDDSYDPGMLCTYGKDSKTVYINLYNGNLLEYNDASPLNKKWKIELYYKGAKVQDMVNVTRSHSTYGSHNKPSDYTSNYSTWLYNSNYLRNDADWWMIARGLASNSSIKNRNGNKWGGALTNSGYKKTTTHIFAGTLPEGITLDSKDVMVRATAPTGQVYEVTEFTRFSSLDGIAWELM